MSDLRPSVEWRRRRDLDALVEAAVAAGGDVARRTFEELRLACRKERRSLARKTAHHCLFAILRDLSAERPVLHLTTNVDGIGSAITAGEMGAWWPALHEPTPLVDVRAGVSRILENGSGFAHLPLHGEAALVVSERGALRTFFGSPSSLDEDGPWQSTLELGVGQGVETIAERLELSRFGYHLLRSLVSGKPMWTRDLVLPPADLVVVGYAAGSRPGRRRLPLERILADRFEAKDDRRQRLVAVLLDSNENATSRSWFERLGFEIESHRLGELPATLRSTLGG